MHKKLLVLVVFALVAVVVFILNQRPTSTVVTDTSNINNTNQSSLENFFADSESGELPKVDTSSWQEYKDVASGIQFRIPLDWEIKSQNIENKFLCLGKKGKQYYLEGEAACGVLVTQEDGLSDWEGAEGKENYKKWKEAYQVTKYKLNVNGNDAVFFKGNTSLIVSIPLQNSRAQQKVILYFGDTTSEEETVFYGISQTLYLSK